LKIPIRIKNKTRPYDRDPTVEEGGGELAHYLGFPGRRRWRAVALMGLVDGAAGVPGGCEGHDEMR
jgi:hypothetical protein